MESKKSFVIHIDSLDVIDSMTGDQTKQLLLAFRDYHLGIEPKLDGLMNAVFTQFKNQFDRDLEKYKITVERNRANGSKGGRPITQDNPNKPSGLFINPTEPKKPDNDNDNDNDNDSDNVNDKINYRAFAHLCISISEFNKLILEGFTKEQIDNTLNSVENFKGNKKYKSLYLTALNWLKKNNPTVKKDILNETAEEKDLRIRIESFKKIKVH